MKVRNVRFLLGMALFPATMPEAKRLEILSPFFSPAPGEKLELDKSELSNIDIKRPFMTRGFIKVSPPKGHCLIVTKNWSLPDKRVCEPEVISFRLADIRKNGRLTWQVSTGPQDIGTNIMWQTPYRLAKVIAQGQLYKGVPSVVPILSCHSKLGYGGRRQIFLKTGYGETWMITLPDRDIKLKEPEAAPNLYHTYGAPTTSVFQRKSVKGTKMENKDFYRDVVPDPDDPASTYDIKKKKGLAKVLAEKADHRYYHYSFGPKKSYVMASDGFSVSGSPKGLLGKCRYRYSGWALGEDGVIDCYLTDTYDAVVSPLSCISAFSPRID